MGRKHRPCHFHHRSSLWPAGPTRRHRMAVSGSPSRRIPEKPRHENLRTRCTRGLHRILVRQRPQADLRDYNSSHHNHVAPPLLNSSTIKKSILTPCQNLQSQKQPQRTNFRRKKQGFTQDSSISSGRNSRRTPSPLQIVYLQYQANPL